MPGLNKYNKNIPNYCWMGELGIVYNQLIFPDLPNVNTEHSVTYKFQIDNIVFSISMTPNIAWTYLSWASLMAKWLRICRPVQEMGV